MYIGVPSRHVATLAYGEQRNICILVITLFAPFLFAFRFDLATSYHDQSGLKLLNVTVIIIYYISGDSLCNILGILGSAKMKLRSDPGTGV